MNQVTTRSFFALFAPPVIFVAFVTAIPVHAACNVVNGSAYGDCTGVRVNSGIKSYLRVTSTINEAGIIEGATILKGGSLYLSGISNGDIVVLKGGRLSITGVANGTIINQGGIVDIEGTAGWVRNDAGKASIGGIVGSVSGSGVVIYRKGAVVGDVPK